MGVLVEIVGGDDRQDDVEALWIDQNPAQDRPLGLGAVGRSLFQEQKVEFHASPSFRAVRPATFIGGQLETGGRGLGRAASAAGVSSA